MGEAEGVVPEMLLRGVPEPVLRQSGSPAGANRGAFVEFSAFVTSLARPL